jgi:CRISPR-associated protein Cas2
VEVGEIVLVLITYDVNTETESGKRRLRKVAKACTNYGQRVQHSVFECVMDAAKAREVKDILEKLIDKSKDSLRFYYLGNNYKGKVEHIGAKACFDMDGLLTL